MPRDSGPYKRQIIDDQGACQGAMVQMRKGSSILITYWDKSPFSEALTIGAINCMAKDDKGTRTWIFQPIGDWSDEILQGHHSVHLAKEAFLAYLRSGDADRRMIEEAKKKT
jgi:hypothetical protein